MDVDGRTGGHAADGDPLPTFTAEARVHDESRLPHMHNTKEIDELFPCIDAAPELPNTDDYDPQRINGNDQGSPRRQRRVDADHKTAKAGPQARSGRRRQVDSDNK